MDYASKEASQFKALRNEPPLKYDEASKDGKSKINILV